MSVITQLEGLIKSKNIASIKQIINEQANDAKPLTESKPVINYLAQNITKLDNASTLDVCDHAIKMLKTRQLQFDEEDTIFKKEMAEVLTAREEYEPAAKILEAINLEQSNRDIKP